MGSNPTLSANSKRPDPSEFMKAELSKETKVLIGFVLLVAAVVSFLFFHLYHRDVKTLRGLLESYKKFDNAISDFSISVFASIDGGASASGDSERRAAEAPADFDKKASVRISSLIRNDAELMSLSRQIAMLSRKEWDNLRKSKTAAAGNGGDWDGWARELSALRDKRQAAYSRFQELLGLKEGS